MKAVQNKLIVALCWLCANMALADDISRRGRAGLATEYTPAYCIAAHRINKLRVHANNFIGLTLSPFSEVDCFTGQKLGSFGCEYPRKSRVDYLAGGSYWIGAVVDGDTIVTTGAFISDGEFAEETVPVESPFGSMKHFSLLDNDAELRNLARSEEDYIAEFNDTLSDFLRLKSLDFLDNRPHKPLGIKFTERSMAWSYEYAEDFILYDLRITNIGQHNLHNVYFGIYVDAGVGFVSEQGGRGRQNITGFRQSHASSVGCAQNDTMNIMWVADNDGDPFGGRFVRSGLSPSAPDIVGVRFLAHPRTDQSLSYNWWSLDNPVMPSYDFGPRKRNNFRNFQTGGTGFPKGDRNRYHVLSNREIDYDQVFTARISPNDLTWVFPAPAIADDVAVGEQVLQALLSVGPFNLPPGAVLDIPFALVAGENFHIDPDNGDNLPDNPSAWRRNVDFSDLAKNALWADWIYDNPGVDSDNDGYAGEFRVCVHESTFVDGQWTATDADTIWYKGDGVPDWRGAAPPPAPDFWITPTVNGLHVRFNGSRSETEKDIWLRAVDFEGYNVYLGRDERRESLSLVASYDRKDYDKWVFNVSASDDDATFELHEPPFTLEQLRCLYGTGVDPCNDSLFDPERFGSSRPYRDPLYPDSVFFFVRHGQNVSQLGLTTPIRKVYPNEPFPGDTPIDSLSPDRLTAEGNLKFYEYEFEIDNLLPTLPYYVNVTAFDFGSPASGLSPLESSPTVGIKHLYPLTSERDTDIANRDVYIYPNPYRKDAQYRARGLEGRTDDRHDDRVRRVHFANLPPRCTIRIFTIDGDMVREISHDLDPSDPLSSHNAWDLISRNGEPAVSGLYYWSVESATRTQLGKLVIVR